MNYNHTKAALKALGIDIPKVITKDELADLAASYGVQPVESEATMTKLDLVLQRLDELDAKLNKVLESLWEDKSIRT